MLILLPAEEDFLNTFAMVLEQEVDHFLLRTSIYERKVLLIVLF